MARVTIEDSLANCPNMFYLIQLASIRAHQLQRGATPKIVNARGEKGIPDAPTVLALREIAAGYVDFENEVIPQKDVWGVDIPAKLQGPEVNKPRHWATGKTEYTAGSEEELFDVRNKHTKEVLGHNLTMDEAKELKAEEETKALAAKKADGEV